MSREVVGTCGPGCVAEDPVLDTVDGREHDNCPDQELAQYEALVAHARDALQGAVAPPYDHSHSCKGARCVVVHLLGNGPAADAFRGDEPLEGYRYMLLADWNIHERRYERVVAYFPRLLGDGETLDLTADVLGTVRA